MKIEDIKQKAVKKGGSYRTKTYEYQLLPAGLDGERQVIRTRIRRENGTIYLGEQEAWNADGERWEQM